MKEQGVDLDYSKWRVPWRRRRPRVRLWVIVLVAVLFPLAGLSALVVYRVDQATRAADDLDARYRQVQRQMTMSQVQAIMGGGGAPQSTPIAGKNFTMWEGDPLTAGEREAIAGALVYKPTPAYTGVFFEFTVDRGARWWGSTATTDPTLPIALGATLMQQRPSWPSRRGPDVSTAPRHRPERVRCAATATATTGPVPLVRLRPHGQRQRHLCPECGAPAGQASRCRG